MSTHRPSAMAVPPSDLHPLLEPKLAEPTQEFDPSVLLVDDDGTTAAWWSALADTASLAATEPAMTNLPPAENNHLPDLDSTGSIDALLLSLLTYTPAGLNPTVASPSVSATSTCAATPTIPTSPTAAHPTPESLPELRPRVAKRATDDATRTIQPNYDPKTMNPTESAPETSRKRSVDASDSTTVVGSPPPPAKRTRRGLTEDEVQLRKQERSRRNREAAQLSREKKKRQVEDLEAHNLTLVAENATLATRMDALEAQNRQLAQQLEECNRLVRTLVATQPPLAADMTARLVACAADCGPPNSSRDGSINHGPEHNDGSRGSGTSALPSPTSSNVSSPPTGAAVNETLAPAAEDPSFGKTAVLDQPTSTGVGSRQQKPGTSVPAQSISRPAPMTMVVTRSMARSKGLTTTAPRPQPASPTTSPTTTQSLSPPCPTAKWTVSSIPSPASLRVVLIPIWTVALTAYSLLLSRCRQTPTLTTWETYLPTFLRSQLTAVPKAVWHLAPQTLTVTYLTLRLLCQWEAHRYLATLTRWSPSQSLRTPSVSSADPCYLAAPSSSVLPPTGGTCSRPFLGKNVFASAF
ncbi:hypothetical protein IWQ60_003573 [Tieghemiomyces parasiticus]|uniref:BZIP domain-containing protein n=1 Tax=Tieghemiomyces parasiticus TaxID=78921 RepID=A0A9W8AA22_9FUNG|nr:hypothetical protein IWQ60_003573 [Tieghemiomyces parasiticus]